ncbi:hypothetical protein MYIN104542_06695 [Mycobacterium intermedium]
MKAGFVVACGAAAELTVHSAIQTYCNGHNHLVFS